VTDARVTHREGLRDAEPAEQAVDACLVPSPASAGGHGLGHVVDGVEHPARVVGGAQLP
jgi:hypothetical protein